MARRKLTDAEWEAVGHEYRAGRPIRQIAREFGVAHTTILRRADTEGWIKDLAGQVRGEAKARAAMADIPDADKKTSREIVAAAGLRGSEVIQEHKGDLVRLKGVFRGLLDQVEKFIAGEEEGFEVPIRGKDKMRTRVAFIGLHESISDVFSKLTQGYKLIVAMEREAFGLNELGDKDEGDVAEAMTRTIERKRERQAKE